MTIKQHLLILGGGLALSLACLEFLGNLAAERARLDYRPTEMSNPYQETVLTPRPDPSQAVQEAPAERGAADAPWSRALRRVEDALAHSGLTAAELAWHAAYAEALRSRRWEGLVEVGDAYLRIGEAAGARKPSEARARELYLAALFRARDRGSLDGVLRVAEAFGALGDREVAQQGIHIAQHLATSTRDAQARERVRVAAERLAARSVGLMGYELD